MNGMKRWFFYVCLCGILTACFPKAEQGRDNPGGILTDYETLKPEAKDATVLKQELAEATADVDTVDHLHTSMTKYAVSGGPMGTDTVYHYPIGRKIKVGMHFGRGLYLELGEFYNDEIYNGAKIYWGDSLIYATDLDVANDWQTCHVHHVDSTDKTYVLLLIDERPEPLFWHILCMDGMDIHLEDYVPAENDYAEGARYFHGNVIYEDLDGDGIIEVGGKAYAELWEDSMTYEPCYIYKLGRRIVLDEAVSESETRKAHHGMFLGFKDGLHIYNPGGKRHGPDGKGVQDIH